MRQLRKPVAMAWHPDGSLWIIDRETSGGLIVDRPGTSTMRVNRFQDDSHHFMNQAQAQKYTENDTAASTGSASNQ